MREVTVHEHASTTGCDGNFFDSFQRWAVADAAGGPALEADTRGMGDSTSLDECPPNAFAGTD